MKKFNVKKKAIIIGIILIVMVSMAFMLAYRYLIERVEAKVVNNENIISSDELKNATYDDWNYESENVKINIKEVSKESGNNKVIYYVADVRLSSITYLKSAFAQNKFGRNILETTSDIANDNNAIFAINGDYYGFRSDGILIRNGTIYRDEAARKGAALYNNGTLKSYDENSTNANELLNNGVLNTFSFGPALVEEGEIRDDFQSVMIDTNFGNRSIQEANPRTGIGMIEPNHFIFVVVDGRSKESNGMTLTEFAELFKELGCTEAYNLDGGGSSTMYFMGRVVNNPSGKNKERKISDILYIS